MLCIRRVSCRFRPSLTHTRHSSNKADDDKPPPWAPRQVPLGDTFKPIQLTKQQNKRYWVNLHQQLNKDWKKELAKMNQRIKERASQPKPEPHLLHMVMRVKTTKGRPYWEKDLMKELGLDGRMYVPKILPNKATVNERLSRIKHLVEILPVRFPYGLPETEEDYEHCVLRDNGEFIVVRKLYEKKEEPAALVTEEDPTTVWDIKQDTIDRTLDLKKMQYQLNAEYYPTEYIYKRNEDGKEFRYSGKDNVGLGKKWY